MFVASRFFDMSKAFDTICHRTLLTKLESIGFSPLAVALVKSYLDGRMQSVYFNNTFSEFKHNRYGVPQGSILGPILFIIYVNDLPSNITSGALNCFMYADDICLSVRSYFKDSIDISFNTDMFVDWCNANSLSLNLDKTQELLISYDNKVDLQSVKFLGIVLQSNLGWQSHINYIHPKVSKGVYMIRKLNCTVSTEVILHVYFAYIHTHLTYGTLLWANNHLCDSLFILQKQAVRLMCKAPPRAHCKELFIKLNILSVPCIYIFQCLMYARKNMEVFTLNSDAHCYNTRRCYNIHKLPCIFSKTLNSFKFTAIKLFNKLPFNFRQLRLALFENKLKSFLLKTCFYSLDEFLTASLDSISL